MQHQRCVCPQCGTTLRVKDRAYFHHPVPCPDCRTLVVIAPNDRDGLDVRLADEPLAENRPARSHAASLATTVARSQHWTPNVMVVSWTAALLVAAMIAGVAFWPKKSRKAAIVEPPVEMPLADASVAEAPPEDELSPAANASQPMRPPAADRLADVPIEPLLAVETEPPEPDFPPADAALVAVSNDLPPQPPKPPMPMIDLEAALAQPLLEFRQDRSIPRRDLLDLVEEMLGAPIRYDAEELGEAAELLDRPISFELQRPTVGDVLAKVLDGTELTPHREPDGLRLKKITATPNP